MFFLALALGSAAPNALAADARSRSTNSFAGTVSRYGVGAAGGLAVEVLA